MYLILICLLILLIWLVGLALKSPSRRIRFLFIISGISILAISILLVISHHYKEINPAALVLVLIVSSVLGLFYNIRRLR